MSTEIPNLLFPTTNNWFKIDISSHVEFIKGNRDNWTDLLEKKYKGNLYGGFLEDRSPFFDLRHTPEALIHIGIDFWMPEGAAVHCPVTGRVVFTKKTNSTIGGWGGRVDIQHGSKVYIFGHLKAPVIKPGNTIVQGEQVGILGGKHENGFWKPHLHLQVLDYDYYCQQPSPENIDAYCIPHGELLRHVHNPIEYSKTSKLTNLCIKIKQNPV